MTITFELKLLNCFILKFFFILQRTKWKILSYKIYQIKIFVIKRKFKFNNSQFFAIYSLKFNFKNVIVRKNDQNFFMME